MWKRHLRRVWMEGAAGDGGAGGGGTAAGTQGTGTDPAAASGAAASGAAGEPSVLAAAAAAAGAPNFDYLPEKFRATKDDGTLDTDASHKKLAEAHAALEARMGAGDVRPKSAAEYVVAVPDALKDAFDPKADPKMQEFLTGAHEAGLTQKQMDFVMGKYFTMAPDLAAGAVALDAQTATTELQKTWSKPEDMQKNVALAYSTAKIVGDMAGVSIDQIMAGPLGNSPEFIRLMAAIGPEFQEDKGVSGAAVLQGESIEDLMRSEAYSNPKHKDHVRTNEKIRRYYEKLVGTAPVM